MNENARMIERIDQHIDKVSVEERRVLSYIKGELTPQAVERRDAAEAGGEKHLREVAMMILRPFKPRQEAS